MFYIQVEMYSIVYICGTSSQKAVEMSSSDIKVINLLAKCITDGFILHDGIRMVMMVLLLL